MQMIPALSILAALLVLYLALVTKLTGEQLIATLTSRSLTLVVGTALFGLVLATHLFAPQEWTADVLKVLVGFLVGTGAAQAAESKMSSGPTDQRSAVDAAGAQFGNNAKVAGRDINETIERLQSDVTNIKDAVVNQYPTIVRALDSIREAADGTEEYLINTLFERGTDRLTEAFAQVVERWHSDGWRLRHVTSDYHGMDGVILVFSRQSRDGRSGVTAYHGSGMEPVRRGG